MDVAALTFPNIDPVALQIGPFAIRWYALAYIAGLLLGWYYALRLVRRDELWGGTPPASPLTRIDIDDFIVWAALGIILGGRLGYVLFYNLPYYLANPVEILMVWEGGMSFHGGLLGLGVAILWFARRRNVPALSLMDITASAGAIGLFFGRIANFVNGELFGRVTDVPWAFVFPMGGPEPRHPSQLYEAALEGLVLFAVLRYLTVRHRALATPGLLLGVFLTGYGLARLFVEFFRMPDQQLGFLWGGLTMGMVLSLPMVAGGLAVIWWARRSGTGAGAAATP